MLGIELTRRLSNNNANTDIPLSRQIYNSIRSQILKGILKPNDILPSTRTLSKELSVSRNTVCEAYEMLSSEGFLESRVGSFTRVAGGLLLDENPIVPVKPAAITIQKQYLHDFRTGRPYLESFPEKAWLQLMHKASGAMSKKLWDYSAPEGLPELRIEIAAWLFRSRGIKVSPENLFITAGATHALHILADALMEYGSRIIVEDPCHTGMLNVLKAKGYIIQPQPVDRYGITIGFSSVDKVGAVYITPSHQFPLGGILPAERRISLINLARENDFYIIEDDYDSEFRYIGPPVTPLFSMDPQRVIYVGTFSKILFPAIRIGYAILPDRIRDKFRYLRIYTDVQNPPFEQAALAEYLHGRRLDRHIQKMKKIYGQKLAILLSALDANFGKSYNPWGDAAGLHLAIEIPGGVFNQEYMQKFKESGIRITTVDFHCINKGCHLDKLLLGYGHMDTEEIKAGIKALHDFIQINGKTIENTGS